MAEPRVALLLGAPSALRERAAVALRERRYAVGALIFDEPIAAATAASWSADPGDRSAIETAVSQAVRWRGRIDCVVRLALGPPDAARLADRYALRLLLPHLLPRAGSVVVQLFEAVDARAAASLERLTRQLAREHAGAPTRFHALRLGPGDAQAWPPQLAALVQTESELESGAIRDASWE